MKKGGGGLLPGRHSSTDAKVQRATVGDLQAVNIAGALGNG